MLLSGVVCSHKNNSCTSAAEEHCPGDLKQSKYSALSVKFEQHAVLLLAAAAAATAANCCLPAQHSPSLLQAADLDPADIKNSVAIKCSFSKYNAMNYLTSGSHIKLWFVSHLDFIDASCSSSSRIS